jgi:hypothetical protein
MMDPSTENVLRMNSALQRIFSAASGILSGEENPHEAARDIQTMVLKGFGLHYSTDWSHAEHPGLAQIVSASSAPLEPGSGKQ